jgi:hypothetical protein
MFARASGAFLDFNAVWSGSTRRCCSTPPASANGAVRNPRRCRLDAAARLHRPAIGTSHLLTDEAILDTDDEG